MRIAGIRCNDAGVQHLASTYRSAMVSEPSNDVAVCTQEDTFLQLGGH